MAHKLTTIIFLWISCSAICFAQSNENLVEYTKNFTFKEGLYLTFNDWKQNNPLDVKQIVTKFDTEDKRFYVRLLSKRIVTYFDGERNQEIKTSEIFGYSKKGRVHTKEHFPIQIIGSICHYTIDLNKKKGQQVMRVFFFRAFTRNNVEQLKSYIIDFEKNSKYFFNRKSIESIVKRDKVLYKKYKKDRRRKRTKMHQYLLEYNERNPIYFPE